jgi:hypothetical protein
MRLTATAFALAAVLITAACSKGTVTATHDTTDSSAPVAQASLTPEELGELGAAIKKNPSDAEKLLSAKGMTEAAFSQAVRKVAEDPAASQRYAAAYKKAGA